MASNPSLVIRVAANLAELKKNLADGKQSIEVTTAGMQKLAAGLDGNRLIQHANNIVAAVNEIGGATKLTEAEKARLNATLEKALEKYRVLGKDAPAGMQQLADDTRTVDKAQGGLLETVKNVALGLAAMFTVRAAVNFVNDVVQQASALKDLAQQTHINVEDLQLLAGAMSEFGVDADTLGKGLFTLSRKIAGGDESVSRALHTMGLSLKDVEGLEGQALFLKMEAGLATLQGSLRDTTASDLFGSRLGMAMAGAAEGIEGTLETQRRLNTVMTGETIDALDTYGEAIERAQRSLTAMAANMIGPVAEGFNTLTDAVDKGASKWAIAWAATKDFLAEIDGAPGGVTHLATLIDDLNRKTEQEAAATKAATDARRGHTVQLTEEAQAAKFLASLQADATVKLTDAQRANLATLKELNALNAQNAAAVGVSAAQLAVYTEEVKKNDAAKKVLIETENAYLKMQRDVATAVGLAEQAAFAATQARAQANTDALRQMQIDAITMAENQAAAEAATEAARIAGNAAATEAIVAAGQTQAAAHQAVGDAAVDSTQRAIAGYAGLAQQVTLTGDAVRAMIDLGKFNAAANAILKENNLYTDADQLRRIAALPSPRANGGPVAAGAPYMVGERGPELFVPGRSGTIVPNGAGSGITVQVHVDARESFYDSAAGVQRMAERVGAAVVARLQARGVAVR